MTLIAPSPFSKEPLVFRIRTAKERNLGKIRKVGKNTLRIHFPKFNNKIVKGETVLYIKEDLLNRYIKEHDTLYKYLKWPKGYVGNLDTLTFLSDVLLVKKPEGKVSSVFGRPHRYPIIKTRRKGIKRKVVSFDNYGILRNRFGKTNP